jgi:protein MpaA
VGIFGGIHGDEPASAQAAVRFLEELHHNPDLAYGYELVVYPLCNPWGYEKRTRWLQSGKDLNREFWRKSSEAEVILLENELTKLQFDGIISLHSDDTSEGVYGFAKGHELTKYVLEPSLEAASKFLPKNGSEHIDNFRAQNGVIETGYEGILGAPAQQHPKPFEIVFETPGKTPLPLQVDAHIAGIASILKNFREMISIAQNI